MKCTQIIMYLCPEHVSVLTASVAPGFLSQCAGRNIFFVYYNFAGFFCQLHALILTRVIFAVILIFFFLLICC